MKRTSIICLWLVMLTAVMADFAWASRDQAQTPPASGVAGQQAPVPGRSSSPVAGDLAALNAEKKKAQEAQALFEESLRQMMPLNEGQIQEYRERSDQRERALLPVSPHLNSRTVRVSLEPGRAPVRVFTTANIATSLVFHDSTGQP